jgi:Protein of unknown function (DUF2867)
MEELTMNAPMHLVRSDTGLLHHHRLDRNGLHHHPVGVRRGRRAHDVPLPSTPLILGALPHVDWSDAYAVSVPFGSAERSPQAWADAVFRSPPKGTRLLFGVRELLVRVVGIERGGSHVFDTVAAQRDEVLLGVDQQHLAFRASVLVEPGRVVLSTVVELRNRRGRAYFALVRRVHPLVVRGLLNRAARKLAMPARASSATRG